ncbi:MAG: sugar transferase [Actinomycetota bacterium]|nr:sugar transferase [Actinomycetota bacterium]
MLDGHRRSVAAEYAQPGRLQERPKLRAVPEPRPVGKYERFAKPVLDRAAGVLLSIVTLPILAVAVPLIWMTMGFPAVFKQRRIGLHGEEFTVYKLRTMRQDRRLRAVEFAGIDRRINHKSAEDPRHTDLGRFLRKWSIDEIPQLWNVALGHMSLIGPRPELPQLVARYEDWQHQRHETRPGMTGLWQVTARGDIPMHEATDLDVEYVRNMSFLGDLRIIAMTIPAMLGSRTGA